MLILGPNDEMEIRYAIHRAVRTSGISPPTDTDRAATYQYQLVIEP